MEPNKQFTDERAVSPVVGVALLIAIAVILAAVIGAVVLGLGSTGADTPQAQLEATIDTTGETVDLTHNGGDPLLSGEIVLRQSGSGTEEVALANNLQAGQTETGITFTDIQPGDTISVVWQDPDSDAETVLETFTA